LSPPPCLRFLPFHHHTLHIFLFSNHFYPHLLQNLTSYELQPLQQLKYDLSNNPTTFNIVNTSLPSSPQILHFYVLFASCASYTSSSSTFTLLVLHILHRHQLSSSSLSSFHACVVGSLSLVNKYEVSKVSN
jgi:hypothetical protein